jgi:hypothetical protein
MVEDRFWVTRGKGWFGTARDGFTDSREGQHIRSRKSTILMFEQLFFVPRDCNDVYVCEWWHMSIQWEYVVGKEWLFTKMTCWLKNPDSCLILLTILSYFVQSVYVWCDIGILAQLDDFCPMPILSHHGRTTTYSVLVPLCWYVGGAIKMKYFSWDWLPLLGHYHYRKEVVKYRAVGIDRSWRTREDPPIVWLVVIRTISLLVMVNFNLQIITRKYYANC